jgi:hypothetical protein
VAPSGARWRRKRRAPRNRSEFWQAACSGGAQLCREQRPVRCTHPGARRQGGAKAKQPTFAALPAVSAAQRAEGAHAAPSRFSPSPLPPGSRAESSEHAPSLCVLCTHLRWTSVGDFFGDLCQHEVLGGPCRCVDAGGGGETSRCMWTLWRARLRSTSALWRRLRAEGLHSRAAWLAGHACFGLLRAGLHPSGWHVRRSRRCSSSYATGSLSTTRRRWRRGALPTRGSTTRS